MSILNHSIEPAKLFISDKSALEELDIIFSSVHLSCTNVSGFLCDMSTVKPAQVKRIDKLVRDYAKKDTGFSFAFLPEQMIVEAVFFDMDATVVEEETIVELAKFAGKSAQVFEITEKAMCGEIDFEQALVDRVAVLKGLSSDVFDDVYAVFTLQPNIKKLVSSFKKDGISSFLVSGGFTQLAERIADRVGIVDARANTLAVKNDILSGQITGPLIGGKQKEEYLREICKKKNLKASRVIAIGDGANDLDMMKAAMLSVGFCPKPILIDHVDVLNRYKDHMFVIDLLNL